MNFIYPIFLIWVHSEILITLTREEILKAFGQNLNLLNIYSISNFRLKKLRKLIREISLFAEDSLNTSFNFESRKEIDLYFNYGLTARNSIIALILKLFYNIRSFFSFRVNFETDQAKNFKKELAQLKSDLNSRPDPLQVLEAKPPKVLEPIEEVPKDLDFEREVEKIDTLKFENNEESEPPPIEPKPEESKIISVAVKPEAPPERKAVSLIPENPKPPKRFENKSSANGLSENYPNSLLVGINGIPNPALACYAISALQLYDIIFGYWALSNFYSENSSPNQSAIKTLLYKIHGKSVTDQEVRQALDLILGLIGNTVNDQGNPAEILDRLINFKNPDLAWRLAVNAISKEKFVDSLKYELHQTPTLKLF